MLPDGRRLHLQHGPIDLIVEAFGARTSVADAYRRAAQRFDGLLEDLCDELPVLRAPAGPASRRPSGPVARRMATAVAPFAALCFITPMAAVAGAVADEILAVMLAVGNLDRAYVNNGGDIALHCAPGWSFTVGMIDRPERPNLFGRSEIDADCGIGGIATSGWRGRSFSLGIADSVTVLAATAAEADAAATVIANAVDLAGHPAVMRAPADSLQPDTDLGSRRVTRAVGRLGASEIDEALGAGRACADMLLRDNLVRAAALHLQGSTRVVGETFSTTTSGHPCLASRRLDFPSPQGEGGSAEGRDGWGLSPPHPTRRPFGRHPPLAGEGKPEPQEIHAHA